MGSAAVTAPCAAYAIGGQRLSADSPGVAEAIAEAHAQHSHPLCLCQPPGTPMYVARLAGATGGCIVKRMPDTGSLHAPNCPSYEPPTALSGLGQVLGVAITENPATGETTLRLDFALSKLPGRSVLPPASGNHDSVATDGTKLSLRGLLQAAQNKFMRGAPLLPRLCIPEVFSVEQRDAINQRRLAHWAGASPLPGKPTQLLLLIGEVKEIVPARYGYKAVIKHMPDQAFALDDSLFRRLGRRFKTELSLWGASSRVHLLMMATFSMSAAGIGNIAELSLMPVSEHWLPVEDAFELDLIERLTREGRTFIKGLRYNLPPGKPLATATLTDAHASRPVPMFIVRHDQPGDEVNHCDSQDAIPDQIACANAWVWRVAEGTMPALPQQGRSPTSAH